MKICLNFVFLLFVLPFSRHWNSTAELAAAQEKQMEVCEVCGAFLIVGDAQQRIDDHLMGKQHVGFARLKAAIEEITSIVKTTKEESRSGRASVEDKRDKERERDRDRRHERSREHRCGKLHKESIYN